MSKKLLALLLAALLTAPAFLSCSDSGTNEESPAETTASTPSAEEETVAEETEPSIYDDVPTGSYDGHNFNMLNVVSNYAYVLLTAEELIGETINDAVFNRNALVGDNLNVTFSEEIVGWGDVAGVITNMVAADDPTYDIVFDEVQASIKYPANGQVLNLYSVEGLDFSKPWWDAGSVETLSVGDSLYMVNGDLHLMYGESAWVLFFNQNMLSEYNLESPYTVIKEGRWTFDKMHEMVSQVALDLNGDGVLNSDDQFGLATHSDFSLVLLTSAGEGLLYKNENNIPEWADLPEKVFDISQKTHNQFFDLNIAFQAYLSPKGTETTDIVPHFMAGKSLFLCEVLGHAKTLRDMEDNFGILPTPKYDEAQEDYNTFIARSAQTLMIPVTNRELPRTAVILENLGAESFKSLRPAYYDVQLSGKTARDADSLEMLDIIFEGRRYEMAYIFGANNVGSAYISSTETGSELASAVTKVSKAVKKVMEKTLAGLIGV
ncbi:MAG: extracellular solute-binding protein [Clostridia bacterium]|nr:extracellular solute-binding protein [Clostridia bacterium]